MNHGRKISSSWVRMQESRGATKPRPQQQQHSERSAQDHGQHQVPKCDRKLSVLETWPPKDFFFFGLYRSLEKVELWVAKQSLFWPVWWVKDSPLDLSQTAEKQQDNRTMEHTRRFIVSLAGEMPSKDAGIEPLPCMGGTCP